MQSQETTNTLQHISPLSASISSRSATSSTGGPGFRVASPSLSAYSGVTSIETNMSSDNRPINDASAFANAVTRQPAIAFNLLDWGWEDQSPLLPSPSPAPETNGNTGPTPTPRARTLSLPRVVAGPYTQLRPIPPEVPESLCPSLYRPGPGSLVNDEEDDEDDQTEADSIWFCNEVQQDALVVTPTSNLPFPNSLDVGPLTRGNGEVVENTAFNPPETFEDFPDLEVVIATLRMTNEDVIVEGGIEDLNSL